MVWLAISVVAKKFLHDRKKITSAIEEAIFNFLFDGAR